MTKRLVFLVPGFFGFTSIGAVNYFDDVVRSLGSGLRRRGVEARIVRCMTQPTASIPRRADVLRRQVIRSGGLAARELHFVGHSTGGLDVRMLLTPDVKIARGDSEARIAGLTRTAISVATPHHGTPLANHFVTVQGQTLLLVLSALATSGQGRGAILAAAKAVALVARLDDWLGGAEGPLDRIAEACCAGSASTAATRRGIPRRNRARPGRRAATDAGGDRSVQCGRWRQPGRRLRLRGGRRTQAARGVQAEGTRGSGVRDPACAVQVAACAHGATPSLAIRIRNRRRPRSGLLDQGLGFRTTAEISDGIVPTLSQVHGRVLHAVRADHLDLVGHYTLAGGGTANWLPSGAGFTPEAFDATWDAVGAAIAKASRRA